MFISEGKAKTRGEGEAVQAARVPESNWCTGPAVSAALLAPVARCSPRREGSGRGSQDSASRVLPGPPEVYRALERLRETAL